MKPIAVLILAVVMTACAAVGIGEMLRAVGLADIAPFILAAFGSISWFWFRSLWVAYRKEVRP